MVPNRGFGERVRQIRQQLKMTQDEFGKKFDPPASKGIVSRWEHGGTPNNARLQKIADLGHVSVDYLLNGNRINHLMVEQGYTPKLLADRLGKDQSVVQQYLNGSKQPAVEDWAALAELFGVSIAYLKGESWDRYGRIVGTNYTFEDFAHLMGLVEEEIEGLTNEEKQEIAQIRVTFDGILASISENIGSDTTSQALKTSSRNFLNSINKIMLVWLTLPLNDEKHFAVHQSIDGINKITAKYIKDLADYAVSVGAAERINPKDK